MRRRRMWKQMYLEGRERLAVAEPGCFFGHVEGDRVTGESGMKMSGPYEYVAPGLLDG